MRSAGIRIPAPFKHRIDSLPVVEEETAPFDKGEGSYNNGGWWEDVWYDDTSQKLMGKVAVPDADAAKKVGSTITEVSPYVKPEHTDGKGNKWEDAIMHIALVNQPIDHDQDNFTAFQSQQEGSIALPEGKEAGLAFWMSSEVQDPTQTINNFESAVTVLRELGLVLPEDTNEENLLERIVMAGQQKAADDAAKAQQQKQQGTTTAPPTGAQAEPTPVAMAQTETLQKQNEFLMSHLTTTKQTEYKKRIEQLVNTGRVTKEYVEQKLLPLLNGYQLSLSESGVKRSDLDNILDALEAVTPLTQQLTPGSVLNAGQSEGVNFAFDDKGSLQEIPLPASYAQDPNADMSPEEVDKVVKTQLSASRI